MGNSDHGTTYVRVGGGDGELRLWHYIYVYSIRLIMRVRYDSGSSGNPEVRAAALPSKGEAGPLSTQDRSGRYSLPALGAICLKWLKLLFNTWKLATAEYVLIRTPI